MTHLLLAALLVCNVLAPRAAEAQANSFSGRGTAVRATVLGVTTVASDTGPLPSSGGTQSASLASLNLPGVLTASALSASTTGAGNQSQAQASIANVNLMVGGNAITATVLTSTATATCSPTPSVSGSSQVLALVINGTPITVSGTPNQTIALPAGAGQVVINEQSSLVTASSADITVNALHVQVIGIADIVFSSSHADVTCGAQPPCFNGISFSGQATVVRATVLGASTVLADTGPLPSSGGTLNSSLVAANVPGLLSANALTASTTGAGTQSQSSASVANLSLTLPGAITVSADILSSNAMAQCNGGTASVSGGSVVLNLVVNGTPITVTGTPNQTVPLPLGLGQLIINQQTSSVGPTSGDITVNALHVIVTGLADVVLSSSHADIFCVPPPITFSGEGTVLRATVAGVTTLVSDTGPLPATGGSLQSSLPTVTVPGLLTASTLSASTTGSGNQSQSNASVASVGLTVGGNTITAALLQSNATAICGPCASVSGGSLVLTLVINGTPVTVTGAPNQTVTLPVGQVIINEQDSAVSCFTGDITVNALHVSIPGTADVVISSSHADVTCQPQPITCGTTTTIPGTTTTTTTVPALPLRHYQCYEVDHEQALGRDVTLVDRFGSETVRVDKLKRLCNPADKNGEDPTALSDPIHLTGYPVKHPTPRFLKRRGMTVTNQFGSISVDVVRPSRLFVPSAKSLTGPPQQPITPPVDHFQCYTIRSRGFVKRSGVTIVDQFGTTTALIKKPYKLCLAANKNNEGILDPLGSLLCYWIKVTPKFQQPGPIFVANQFGTESLEKVSHVDELCVPSTVTP